MILKKGLPMEQKSFAMGVRIEHSQSFINNAQYGKNAKFLPAADYKLICHLPSGNSAHTFSKYVSIPYPLLRTVHKAR